MSQASTEVTVREVRALATALLPEVATLAEAMLEYLLERIPEAGGDEEIEGLTLGSCSSNIEQALSMVRHGIPVSATEAPVTALEHARAMAARGRSVDVMLRFYRLGHAFFIERLHREIRDVISDPDALLAALEELERFAFGYIDAISSQVAAEYVAELERRQNRARAVRTDTVRTLLAGTKVDLDAAERVLAHRLSEPQLAFVCWASRGDVDLAPVASAVAGLLGSTRPLLQPDGAQALWGSGVREGEERAALLAVLDARGSLAAAAEALGVHRNTVLQRVRRAEERRGRSAQENALELHAALRLVAVLGRGVLTQS